MRTEELLQRSYSALFALHSFHRQVNATGHLVHLVALKLCWGTYVLQRGVLSHTTKGFRLKSHLSVASLSSMSFFRG